MKLTDKIFHDENAARAHMERLRWPDGPFCPHCGNADAETIKRLEGESHRHGLFQCNACREHFTVTVGTVMERSHIPLHKWVLAFHLMNASKKGISAHQMHRMLGITYKSAWFMRHRIRETMRDFISRSARNLPRTRPWSTAGTAKANMSARTVKRQTTSKISLACSRKVWSELIISAANSTYSDI